MTLKKLRQMQFAAELYSAHHATNKNLRLAVVGFGAGEAIELLEVE